MINRIYSIQSLSNVLRSYSMPWDRNSLKHCKVERKSHTMVMNVALPLDFWLMACPLNGRECRKQT